jgi:vitamin B12 transporter
MRASSIGRRAENARRSSQTTSWFVAALLASATVTTARADDAAPSDGHETIVVVDALAPHAREDEAASSTVITSDRTPRSAETLPDLLGDVPGVGISRLGGLAAPALVSLRGSAWDQVSVYLDGVNLNIAAGGGVDLSTLPVGDVARVEVYRGVTPIAYGGSAIGGVIAIETERPKQTSASVTLGGGSFGTWLGGGSVQVADKNDGLYLGLHGLRSLGDFTFLDNKGTAFDPTDDEVVHRQNNEVRELDGVLRGYLTLPGDRELSLILLGFASDQGIAGFPKFATSRSQDETRRAIASVAYQSHDELGERNQLRAQAYAYQLDERFRDPLAEVSSIPTDASDRTRAVGGTLRSRWTPAAWMQPAIIVDVRHESFKPTDELTGDQGVASTRLAGVAGAESTFRIDAARLAIIPSVRAELSRDVTAGRGSFGEIEDAQPAVSRALPITRLAVTQSPFDGLILRANVGRYARLPSFLELYGDNGFILGNPALVPEHGTTADVGAGFAGARHGVTLLADVAGFTAVTDQLIQFQQNTFGVARAHNIGRARVLGVESSAELRYAAARLYAQATFTDARDESDNVSTNGKQIPYRPRVHATARPELRGQLVRGIELGAYVELDFETGNFVDSGNVIELPARTVVGAGASIGFAGGRARLIASATNLTNASIVDVLSFPVPGRAFYLTLALATEPQVKEP